MKNVYRITFDIRVGRTWLAGSNPNGWAARSVLANGDARSAITKLERDELRRDWNGKRANAVRVIKIEQIAGNVLV